MSKEKTPPQDYQLVASCLLMLVTAQRPVHYRVLAERLRDYHGRPDWKNRPVVSCVMSALHFWGYVDRVAPGTYLAHQDIVLTPEEGEQLYSEWQGVRKWAPEQRISIAALARHAAATGRLPRWPGDAGDLTMEEDEPQDD